MKIKKFKKKCIVLSLVLIMTGAIISTVGFGIAGFSYNRLKDNAPADAWYQTIHISSENPWYGVGLGDNIHLLSIGAAE